MAKIELTPIRNLAPFEVSVVKKMAPVYERRYSPSMLMSQHMVRTHVGDTYYEDSFWLGDDEDEELTNDLVEALYLYHVQRVRRAEGPPPSLSPRNTGIQS